MDRYNITTRYLKSEWDRRRAVYATHSPVADETEQYNYELALLRKKAEINSTQPIFDLTKVTPAAVVTRTAVNYHDPYMLDATSRLVDAITYTDPAASQDLHTLRIRKWFTAPLKESSDGSRFNFKLGAADSGFEVVTTKYSGDVTPLHARFVGMMGTNPLRKYIPNFAYVVGGFECNPTYYQDSQVVGLCSSDSYQTYVDHTVYEQVSGPTLETYLKSCSFDEFIDKLLQLLLAINLAFNECQFTHNDLIPTNVKVRPPVGRPRVTIPYRFSTKTMYVTTDGIATITNYDRAHLVYQGRHYGYYRALSYGVEPVAAFPIADAYKLICSSMLVFQNHKRDDLFDKARKLLKFFNTTDSAELIISDQLSAGFILPRTDYTERSTLPDLIQYILLTYQPVAVSSEPRAGVHVFGCMTSLGGQDICYDEAVNLQSVKTGNTNQLIDYYLMISELNRRGYGVQATEALAEYSGRVKSDLDTYLKADYLRTRDTALEALKFSIIQMRYHEPFNSETTDQLGVGLTQLKASKYYLSQVVKMVETRRDFLKASAMVIDVCEWYGLINVANTVKLTEQDFLNSTDEKFLTVLGEFKMDLDFYEAYRDPAKANFVVTRVYPKSREFAWYFDVLPRHSYLVK